MSCATFTIGIPTPPSHPYFKVYLEDDVGTPIHNPDALGITVGVKLYARRAIAGASDDFVAGTTTYLGGGSNTVNIKWLNQVHYSDEQQFTFSSRVKCSSGRELRSNNPTVFIVEL